LGRVNPEFGPYQLPAELSDERRDQIDFILRTVLGPFYAFLSTNHDGVPILALASYSNFGSVDTTGVDVGTTWALADRWTLDLNYSWFDFEIQDSSPGLDQLLLPNAPENSASAALTYAGPRFDAALSARWSDDFRWVVGPFQGDVPSYTVVDLVANFQINDHWGLGLNVSNLLDEEHWESFGGDLLSRRALGSVTFRW
ncbi:MAG TPA: TonB-dependent receptor, partial [Thermoanaerobaculia bacterium]|nr:TonB-dependent receptor [Thermoanaerobaculia bacterium]